MNELHGDYRGKIFPRVSIRFADLSPEKCIMVMETFLRKRRYRKYFLQHFHRELIVMKDTREKTIMDEMKSFYSEIYKATICGSKVALHLISTVDNIKFYELDPDQTMEEERLKSLSN